MESLQQRLRREHPIIWPRYRGESLINLSASILNYFGCQSAWPGLDLAGFPLDATHDVRSIVILLVDALGAPLLHHYLKLGIMPNLQGMLQRPESFHSTITTVFPSTTATAFLAFNTGRTPAELGVFADNQWEPTAGAIVRTLNWTTRSGGIDVFERVKPKRFPTLYESLREQDIATYVVSSERLAETPMARLAHAGATYLAYDSPALVAPLTAESVRMCAPARSVTFVYWPTLDDVCHDYGPISPETAEELRFLDVAIERLSVLLSGSNTLLLITADHGQIASDKNREFLINRYPEIVDLLSAPAMGDRRAAWLRAVEHQAQKLQDVVHATFGDDLVIAHAHEVNQTMLLGPELANLQEKVGDLLVFPRHAGKIWYDPAQPDGGFGYHKGLHGGLTPAEMLIPLIAVCL